MCRAWLLKTGRCDGKTDLVDVAVHIGLRLAIAVPAKSDWGRAGLAALAAAVPSVGLFALDMGSIGNAAAFGVAPVLFLMFLIPSGFGVHLASLRKTQR